VLVRVDVNMFYQVQLNWYTFSVLHRSVKYCTVGVVIAADCLQVFVDVVNYP